MFLQYKASPLNTQILSKISVSHPCTEEVGLYQDCVKMLSTISVAVLQPELRLLPGSLLHSCYIGKKPTQNTVLILL